MEIWVAGVPALVTQDYALDGAAIPHRLAHIEQLPARFFVLSIHAGCAIVLLCCRAAEHASAAASPMEASGHTAFFLYAQRGGPGEHVGDLQGSQICDLANCEGP